MANDNDEVQQQSQPTSRSTNNNNCSMDEAKTAAVAVESLSAEVVIATEEGGDKCENAYKDKDDRPSDGAQLNARGNINDLVADLCVKSRRSSGGPFGDYTNIRATLGAEASSIMNKSEQTSTGPGGAEVSGHSFFTPTQNSSSTSSFSFKHFLNSSSNSIAAPSTTVTALNPTAPSSSAALASNTTSAISAASALQTSTGARPKVPQSASSLGVGSSCALSASTAMSATTTKMKRSPRFSSFDSQASLAEYANDGSGAMIDMVEDCAMGGRHLSGGGGSSVGFRLYPDESAAGSSTGTGSGGYERQQYVPRSYSNYDMPLLPPASPRRRMNAAMATKETPRSTRLSSSKLKLDLPIDSATSRAPLAGGNAPDFPAAAALPDFVQDHSWYDKHLNSPPSSPMRDFVEDVTGGLASCSAVGIAGSDGGGGNACNIAGGCGGSAAVGGGGGPSGDAASGAGSKMLPDFLSDGPIIHSSQRLADVAAGLPSNSIGSPEEESPALATHVSRLHQENERLQRELADACIALGEQTRRGNDLERQLQQERQQQRHSDSAAAYSQRTMTQNMTQVETSLDKSKRRTAAAQQHVGKLKQQVTQLTAELETLRRENDMLREFGAVGGCSASGAASASVYCDRAAAADGIRLGGRAPPPSQRLSRELLRAASNAEGNLRQLLLGVENLRQMAAHIESSSESASRLPADALSPDLYPDFLDDDCDDDYDEYQQQPGGGPAL